MPYSPQLAATLSGATLRQLQYWRRESPETGALLEPEYGRQPRVLYSYRDLVALRMFVKLRQHVSLQKIRKGVEWLEENHAVTHLSTMNLNAAPEGKSIIWISDDGDYFDIVTHPGQAGFEVVMEELLGSYRVRGGRLVPDLRAPTRGITISPTVRGGFPVIQRTRIPYSVIAGLHSDGLSVAEIREMYPGVGRTEIDGADEFAELVREASGPVAA